ncbi:MAG: hypothetical protein ACP6IY_11100 [Promethearchaeia archaeon]
MKKFLFKTVIDCLIAGLFSIGVYQSPTYVINSFGGYFFLSFLLCSIVALMIIYSKIFGSKEKIFKGILIIVVISVIETTLIGLALNYKFDMILTVWFITIPSVIIFDRLLNSKH